MADDPNQPEPETSAAQPLGFASPTDAANPLGYWHSDERVTPTPLLVLALLGGMGLSFALIVIVGGICAFPLASGPARETRYVAAFIAVAWVGVAIGCLVQAIRRIRQRGKLPPELWRMPGRFFALGFLIGCGLAALLEGICYSVGATSG